LRRVEKRLKRGGRRSRVDTRREEIGGVEKRWQEVRRGGQR